LKEGKILTMASGGYQRLSKKDLESGNSKGAAQGSQRDLSAYLQDVDVIQRKIQEVNNLIDRLESLYLQARELSGEEWEESKRRAETLASQIQDASSVVRNKLKALDLECKHFPVDSSERTQRRNQWSLLTDKFMKTLQRNLQVQDVGRKDMKTKVERQFRIVNPNATEEDIQTIMDGERGNIFTTQLLNSERSVQAQSVLREVKDRQAELQRIEKSAAELAALFQDMQTLVEHQNEVIKEVVVVTGETADVTKETVKVLTETVDTAKSAQSKKRILLLILILVVLVITILAIVVANKGKTAISP